MRFQTEGAQVGERLRTPVGTLHVVDPSPLNWLFITWNTMEEPIRVDEQGQVVPALATDARWIAESTLELDLREGVRFQDGEPFDAAVFQQAFEETQRWAAPHPPGTWLNFHPDSTCEIVGDHRVQVRFPEPDGLALGKMRGFHIPSPAFWREVGFGYAKEGSGEGHW
jgi:ABC-type transport system substrate-binding protein